MIATGGLLRMNRRQDSLRAKNRAENKRKRKLKKRKKNDVVVVKGKLNLCSVAGLVAAVGIMILMVGISMAVLGYWPSPNHQEYQERRRTGVPRGNWLSYSKSPPVSSNWSGNQLTADREVSLNESHATNSSLLDASPSCGFLCEFLDTYLYSDNLKVFGPLVMGIGIFLFICANAVLHENRDKKTKIINLRDIYSTVIDLHTVRSKEYSPLNGLVNYTQSRSPDGLPGPHGAGVMHGRSSWPNTGLDEVYRRPSLAGRPRSWSRDIQTFTDTVYSIYRDHSNSGEHTPQPRQWGATSIVSSSVNAFTLPVIKLNNREVEESGRTEADAQRLDGEVVGDVAICAKGGVSAQADGSHVNVVPDEEKEPSMTDPCLPQERHGVVAAPSEACEQRQEEAQMQLFPPSPAARAMGSRLSLNSLTDQPRSARRCSLSVSTGRQGDRGRRFSCPRLERSNSKGYIKLADLGGESFDAADTDISLLVSDQEIEVTTAAETEMTPTTAVEEIEPQGESVLVTPSTSAEP